MLAGRPSAAHGGSLRRGVYDYDRHSQRYHESAKTRAIDRPKFSPFKLEYMDEALSTLYAVCRHAVDWTTALHFYYSTRQ
jgi:hypothetical protein